MNPPDMGKKSRDVPGRPHDVLDPSFLHTTFFYLFGREDDLEHQLCDAEREADGIGAVDEDVLGGHDAVDGPQQGVGAPVVRVRVRVTGPQQGVGAS